MHKRLLRQTYSSQHTWLYLHRKSLICLQTTRMIQTSLNLSAKGAVDSYLRVISNKGKYTELFQVHANHLM